MKLYREKWSNGLFITKVPKDLNNNCFLLVSLTTLEILVNFDLFIKLNTSMFESLF